MCPEWSSQAVETHAGLLRDLGIVLQPDDPTGADVLWVYWERITPEMLNGDTPLIIDEASDLVCVCPTVRQYANESKAVCGIAKPHVLRDRRLYDAPQYFTGYHHTLFQKLHPECYPVEPESPGPAFDTLLIEVTIGYSCHIRLDEIKQDDLDWSATRPIDVHFAGTMKYADVPSIELHRRLAYQAVHELGEWGYRTMALPGRKMDFPEYTRQLRQSKICVSPWGWGVCCHRDAEAILNGCLLVKPLSDFVETWPDILNEDKVFYIDVQPDCIDLGIKIDTCFKQWPWDELVNGRRQQREWLIEESSPERIAERFRGIIERCLERAK